MTTRTASCGLLLLVLAAALPAHAQIATYPTPPPTRTADTEDWHLSGGPIVVGGILFFPAGPVRHFNPNEMVAIGTVGAVPLYIKTTIEPRSVVFVPLAGGLVRPYEQRRAGDLAGTVGSRAPGFPVMLPAEERSATTRTLRAAVPPTGAAASAWGITLPEVTGSPGAADDEPQATTGTHMAGVVGPRHVRIGPPPAGINGIFIEYGQTRWFASGPAVPFAPARFRQIGALEGFPVYLDPAERGVAIYVPVTAGAPDRVTRYERQ
jgi:hypothetical protein